MAKNKNKVQSDGLRRLEERLLNVPAERAEPNLKDRQEKMDRLDDLWDNLVEAKNALRKEERENDPMAKETREYIKEVEAEIKQLKRELGKPFSS